MARGDRARASRNRGHGARADTCCRRRRADTGGGGVRVEGRRARGSRVRCNGAIFLGAMPSAPPTLPLPACASVSGRLSSIATIPRAKPPKIPAQITRRPPAPSDPPNRQRNKPRLSSSLSALLHATRGGSAKLQGGIHPAVSSKLHGSSVAQGAAVLFVCVAYIVW